MPTRSIPALLLSPILLFPMMAGLAAGRDLPANSAPSVAPQENPPADEPIEVPPEVDREQRRAWAGFPVFVWMESEGPPLDAATLRRLEKAGLGGCNIEAGQSSLVPAVEQIPFYVGHLAGKGNFHMRSKVFDAQQKKREEEGEESVRNRPVGLLEAAMMKKTLARVEKGVIEHRASRPLAYSLEDEISVTFFNAPFDYSFDSKTLRAMALWLQRQYVDLDHLNEVWGSDFKLISQIVPDGTTITRQKNVDATVETTNFAAWADHREFMEVLFASLVERVTKTAASLDPGVPVGFLGGQAPSAFGGYDWWLLARTGTFFEAYDHGMAPELIHAFKKPGTRVVSTLFLDDEGEVDKQLEATLYQRCMRGDDGAVIWSSKRAMDAAGDLTEGAISLGEKIGQVRAIKKAMGGFSRAAPEVFVYVSQASVRAGWMFDSWLDGGTWIRRLNSYENENSTTIRSRESWGTLLDELSIPWSFVDSRDFVSGGGAEFKGKVIVLNETMALSDREVHELIRFTAAGGLLVGDGHTALFDEKLRGRDTKALTALFGVERRTDISWNDLCEEHVAQGDDLTHYFGLRAAESSVGMAGEQVRAKELGYSRELALGNSLYLNLEMPGWDDVAEQQSEKALSFREQFGAFLRDIGGVSRPPHLGPDQSCRKLCVKSLGIARKGACLVYPIATPFTEVEYNLHFPTRVSLFDVTGKSSVGSGIVFRLVSTAGKPVLYRWSELKAGGGQSEDG